MPFISTLSPAELTYKLQVWDQLATEMGELTVASKGRVAMLAALAERLLIRQNSDKQVRVHLLW